MAENWIRTDEAEDVAGSIRHILQAAQLVREDPQAWKWVVLALHSALQGACVCHLTTSAAPVGAVTETNTREWLAYFQDERTNPKAIPPKTKLKGLPDLLKTVRQPHSAGDRSNAEAIAVSDSELSWLTRFHKEVRNQFVHFEPMGWSIEVSGIPEMAKLIARIIGSVLDVGYAFRHLKCTKRIEMQQNLRAISSNQWSM